MSSLRAIEKALVYLKRVGASRLPSKQSEHFNWEVNPVHKT